MFTRCPQCETVFRVTANQLRAARGDVRCGNCTHVFNAMEYLADELPQPSPAEPATDNAAAVGAPEFAATEATQGQSFMAAPREDGDITLDGELEAITANPQEWSAMLAELGIEPSDIEPETDAEEDAGISVAAASLMSEADEETEGFAAEDEVEAVFPEPADREPDYSAPAYPESAEREPTYSAPEDSESTAFEPDTSAPAYREPTDREPIYSAPEDSESTDFEPDYFAPAYPEPFDSEPGPSVADQATAETAARLAADADADTDEVQAPAEPAATVEPDTVVMMEVAAAAARPAGPPVESILAREAEEDADLPLWDELEPVTETAPARRRPVFWAATALLLAGILAIQLIHQARDSLAAHPRYGEWVRNAYARLNQQLYPDWSLDAFYIRRSEALAGGSAPDALDISAAVEVTGGQPVGLPLVRVTLRDQWANTVGRRVFVPEEYLATDMPDIVAPGTRIPVALSLVDPGGAARGYEVDLCLQRRRTGLDCQLVERPYRP